MATRQPRYSKEEFAQRGNQIYQNEIRQKVEAGNHGKIVAIGIETRGRNCLIGHNSSAIADFFRKLNGDII